MSGWDKFKSEAEVTKPVNIPVVVDEATKDAAIDSQYVNNAMRQLTVAAQNIAKDFVSHQIEKGRSPHIDKMTVSVSPAVMYNKEQQKETQIYHKDGTPAHSLKVDIKRGDCSLTLYAKENLSEGISFSNLTAKYFEQNKEGKKTIRFLRNSEIQSSNIPAELKAFAAEINANVIEQENTRTISLFDIAQKANDYYRAEAGKEENLDTDWIEITTDDGEKRNIIDNYAKYVKDDFGEKVQLVSHSDNILVELKMKTDGQRYAIATNFDIKLENGGYAQAFINKPEDLKDLEINERKAYVVSEFKGFGLEKELAKQAEVQKAKEANKSDKQSKTANKKKNEVER